MGFVQASSTVDYPLRWCKMHGFRISKQDMINHCGSTAVREQEGVHGVQELKMNVFICYRRNKSPYFISEID